MTPDQQDLLQSLAYLYLRHGQNRRALTLILLAARKAPDDVGVMRTLAYAFIANDAPEEALDVIERLERLDFAGGAGRIHRLLKARALLHAGRRVEAKAVFRQFVAMRTTEGDAIAPVGIGDRSTDADPDEARASGDQRIVLRADHPSRSTGASARSAGMT